jgi:NitT/TauT family transport system substrate-binding protein
MKKLLLGLAVAASITTVAGAAQAAEKITVAALRLSSSGPLFVAKEMGHFEKEGLDVEFAYVDAASKAPVAVVSGDADFAVTGATAGFYNLAGKGALQIIGAQSREKSGFPLVAYMAGNKAYEDGFKTLDDFPGKSIGMTTVGSTFHYAMGALADKRGFDLAEVKLVPLQGLGAMNAALKGGSVDGILTVNTIAKKLEDEGSGKILGWVGDETPWQLGVLITSTEHAEKNREMVEKFVRAYQAGAEDFYNAFLAKPGEKGENYEEVLQILMDYLQRDRAAVEGPMPYIDPKGRLDVQSIYDQIEWWQEQGLVDKSVKAEDLLDLSYIDGHFNVPQN